MRRSTAVLCGVTLAAFVVGAALADDKAALTGVWTLDQRASDDPQRLLREGERGGSGLGSRVARGVTIFGIPVGNLPRPARDEDEEDLEEALTGVEHVFEATYKLAIRQEGDVTEIQYGTDPKIAYRHGTATQRNGATARAEWRDDALTIEHELADGARVSERYAVESRSGDLHWTVRFKRRKESTLEIERAFYRARDSAP